MPASRPWTSWSAEAQQLRWTFALLRLSRQHLRDYLKRLPAFEDGEAQEQALDLVLQHPYLGPALPIRHH